METFVAGLVMVIFEIFCLCLLIGMVSDILKTSKEDRR